MDDLGVTPWEPPTIGSPAVAYMGVRQLDLQVAQHLHANLGMGPMGPIQSQKSVVIYGNLMDNDILYG